MHIKNSNKETKRGVGKSLDKPAKFINDKGTEFGVSSSRMFDVDTDADAADV